MIFRSQWGGFSWNNLELSPEECRRCPEEAVGLGQTAAEILKKILAIRSNRTKELK